MLGHYHKLCQAHRSAINVGYAHMYINIYVGVDVEISSNTYYPELCVHLCLSIYCCRGNLCEYLLKILSHISNFA